MRVAQLRKSSFALTVSFCLTSILCGSVLAQNTIHVPADVPTISQAIQQAQNGDTVLVSPGTYFDSIWFQGKAITVASTDGPAVTILDANNVGGGPMFQNGEGPQSVLRGFTITNGTSLSSGAGVYIQGASPTIDGNIITGNHGCQGLGITAINSSAIISNNVITNNIPVNCSGFGAGGGGILVFGSGNVQILNNTIRFNQVWGNGGGVEIYSNGSPLMVTITGNTIQNNSAALAGGGISVELGSVANGSQTTIVNNLITGNTGGAGSGVHLLTINGSQNVFVNNTIALNAITDNQQPVWMSGDQNGTQFVNNLIVDGAGNGAVGCNYGSAPGEFASNDIISTQPSSPPQAVPPFVGCPDATGTNGNISVDPQFVSPAAANDFHLQSTSPVIDVGTNTAPHLPDKDLDGNGRIGPGSASTCAAIVDMGAYEYALTSSGSAFLFPVQDFGTVAVGNSSTPQTLNVFVQGCVQVKAITIAGDFNQTNTCGHAISSSSSCSIQVTFAPVAAGPRTGSLSIDFGSSAPAVSTTLSGTGLLVAPSISPSGLTFGSQVVGTASAAQTVTVSSGGSQNLQIASVSITGDYTETNSCVGPPVAAPTCYVNVSFSPAAVGDRPGAMVINTNLGSFNVTLDGTGIAPQPQFSTSILAFGNQLLNTTSAPQTVTLTNAGIGTLQILGFDDYDSEFKLTDQSCVPSLAQGASCTITVTFTPTQVGNKVTGFDVVTNNGTPGVALRGTGVLAAAASLTPTALTFASQPLNTTSSAQVVTLTNTGGESLLIASIAASGDFAQTNTCAASFDPGASCTINVTFTPLAGGSRTGTLIVNSNSSVATPAVSLSGTGQVVQVIPVTASPTSLTFPLTAVNTTSNAQSVSLTNSGSLPVTIASIATGLDYAETNTCGTSLDVGASCTISVTFTPSLAGADNDNLTISGDFGSPVVVALNGSGQAQGPSGTLSPTFLVFSNQAAGTTSPPQSLTYTNTGTDPIAINGISIGFGPFAETNNCAASLAPGDSCTINITFTPPDTTGWAGTLNVNGTGNALAVLAGSSLPQLVSPASLNFGHLAVNTTSPIQTVTFTNTTGSPINLSGFSWPSPFNVVNHCLGTIAAGASCTFDTTFAPTSAGLFAGFFEITGNFAGSPATLPIVGAATGASASLTPPSTTFASQALNTTSTSMPFTLKNTGSLSLNIGSIQVSGDFTQTNNCQATLAPATTCTINVAFAPTAVGSRTGALSVSTDPTVSITPVSLAGTGVTAGMAIFSPQSLDFGSLGVGSSSTQTVTLTNNGSGPLTFSLFISGDFSLSSNCGASVAPGASCALNVTFRPTAIGNRASTLSMFNDNSTPEPSPVALSGTGTAAIGNFSLTFLSLGAQLVGTTSAAQPVVLTNSGNVALSIGGFSFSQAGAPYFSQTNNCGASLAAGASCTISVVFSPAIRGSVQAALNVSSNSTPATQSLTVSGIGQVIQGSVSPTTLSFGSQSINTTSAAQNVSLTNSGDLPLAVSGITPSGDFAQTNTCGASLAVNASCTVAVTFTPTAVGSRSGSLTFTSSATTAISSVSLSGSGTLPAPSLAPSTLSFSPQVIGSSSAPQPLILTNTALAAISITAINPLPQNSDFSQTNNCGSSLAAGASCTVNVTFTPTLRGSRTASLSVTGNFAGTVVSSSLSGTGQAILATASPSSLTFAPAVLNLTSAAQTITFTNSGDTTASIAGVLIAGDFAETNNCGTSLAAGASCSLNVTFTPTARGSRSGTVTLQGNFTSPAPMVTLAGSGQATLASLSPATLDFGNEPVNTTSNQQAFTYTNTGDLPLTISGVTVTSDFSQTNNCPASLAVNSSCTISVTFVPRSTGAQAASLTVSGTVNSSSTVTGTGVMPLATLSPATLNFGSQRAGTTSSPQLVTVTNTGAFPFFVNQISFPGSFPVTNNCSGVIAVGGSCTVSVVFAPSSTQSGPLGGSLTVGGDFTATPTSVSLSGTATTSAGTLSPAGLTFANQNVGTTSAAQTLTLTNTGNGTINLTGVQVTGDYAQTNNCGPSVAPGSSCSIAVTFTPTAHGARSGAITVSGDFTGAAPSVALSGNGTTPTASWSPASLSFSSQLVGSLSQGQTVTLTNGGDGPLTINAIAATGDFAETNNCGSALSAGAGCAIAVTFTPSAAGSRNGTLSITSNSSVAVNPITLSGTGLAPAASLSSASLTFANQLVNTSSAAQTLTLTNTGTATLNIQSILATGDFAQTNNCGAAVTAGSSCTILVTFTPTITGSRSGTLTVSDDTLAGGHQTVSLNGTGIAPAAAFSVGNLSFAGQLVNSSSSPQSVTLSNTGSATLAINSINATGDFAETNNCGTSLAAGASCSVNVTFTPTARGSRSGTLTLQGNFTPPAPVVNLSGTGQALLASLTPAAFNFGSQDVSTTSGSQTATFTNTGDLPVNINSVSMSGDFVQTNNCNSPIAVGASCSFNITFTPTNTGNRSGTLTVSGNFQGAPAVVSLSGTGVMPGASFAPTSLSYGSERVGTPSAAQSVSLTNTGSGPLLISVFTITGDYSQTNNCGTMLAAGSACTINVVFSPTARGSRNGTLTLSSNAPGGSPTVALTGTGVASIVSLSPTSLNFNPQHVGTISGQKGVNLTNSGDFTLNISSISITGDFAQSNNCGATLAPGAHCTINVKFAPTTTGIINGALVIADDALNGPQQTVTLTGTGK